MNAMVRWANPMSTLSSIFDDVLSGNPLFAMSDRELTSTHWPRVDIVEDDDAFRIRADLPGLSREQIKVSVEKDTLTISGEKKEEKREEKKTRYCHLERTYGTFSRSFTLPENVAPDRIEAFHKDGVLELVLKKSERAMPKAVEVKIQ